MDHMDQYPLVKEWLQEAITNGDEFTAWTVTNDISQYHSVQHKFIKPAVHTLMLDAIEHGDYARRLEAYPNGDAWLYYPTKMSSVPMHAVVKSDGQPSKAVTALGYDHLARALLVEFTSGGTYRYNNVPASVFAEFLNADSKGQFFHARIKDVYT